MRVREQRHFSQERYSEKGLPNAIHVTWREQFGETANCQVCIICKQVGTVYVTDAKDRIKQASLRRSEGDTNRGGLLYFSLQTRLIFSLQILKT